MFRHVGHVAVQSLCKPAVEALLGQIQFCVTNTQLLESQGLGLVTHLQRKVLQRRV
jgi:hypothetical protein